jgi:hypothetical protein
MSKGRDRPSRWGFELDGKGRRGGRLQEGKEPAGAFVVLRSIAFFRLLYLVKYACCSLSTYL